MNIRAASTRVWALMLTLPLTAAQAANDPEVLKASIALTDLQWTVTSLSDLSRQPAVVTGTLSLDSQYPADPTAPTWSDSLLPASPLNFVGENGSSHAGPDGLRVQTSATLSAVTDLNAGFYVKQSPAIGWGMSAAGTSPLATTLAAGSLITFSGTMSATYDLNDQPVRDWIAAQGNITSWSLSYGGTGVFLGMSGWQSTSSGDVVSSSVNVELTTPYDLIGSNANGASHLTVIKPFSISLANTSTEDMTVSLDWTLVAAASGSLTVLTNDPTPTIPEPASFGLMLMGLAGLGWRASSRRAHEALTA